MATKNRSKSVYQQPQDSSPLLQQRRVRRQTTFSHPTVYSPPVEKSQKMVTQTFWLSTTYPHRSEMVNGISPRLPLRRNSRTKPAVPRHSPNQSPKQSPSLPREKVPNLNTFPGIPSPSIQVKLPKPKPLRREADSMVLPSIPGVNKGRPATAQSHANPIYGTGWPLMIPDGHKRQNYLLPTASPLSPPVKNRRPSYHSPLSIRRVSLQQQPSFRYFRHNKGTEPSNSPKMS